MRVHGLLVIGLVSLGVVAAVSAQGSRQTPAPDPTPALLAEVRGLRAELNRATGASMRIQFLMARLGVQEGRVNAVGGQLSDVRQQLMDAQLAVVPVSERMERLKAAGGSFLEEVKLLQSELETMKQHERALQGQASQLEGVLTREEQAWADLAGGIDAMERELSIQR